MILLTLLTSTAFIGLPARGSTGDPAMIRPGEEWNDTDGERINAHGGGMLYHEGVYYWFGEFKRKTGKALDGISCYSSTNLVDWKNEGIALKVINQDDSEICPGSVMERPKVIYNEKTGNYVMWFHLELKGQGYKAARTGVAVSDKITGPYTYLRSYRPNAGVWPANIPEKFKAEENDGDEYMQCLRRDHEDGQMSRDMTLYVDDDGKAYHIHASEENYTLHISELSDDYTSFSDRWVRVLPGGHNEAPAVFKYRGKYFLITSGCTGWQPNTARLHAADSIMGEWTYLGNPCIGENAELTFGSQSTYILPVEGREDAFIFMADRWNPDDLSDSRYIWLPVRFNDDQPYLQWLDKWSLSAYDR
jgi:hypothetical protein